MKCPVDGAQLQMTERQGIEIDYCPECRGVWLDRGELDKIIDRSGTASEPRYGSEPQSYERGGSSQSGHHGEAGRSGGHGGKRKRRGFLGDMFDFD